MAFAYIANVSIGRGERNWMSSDHGDHDLDITLEPDWRRRGVEGAQLF
jgi:hypothetical protein